MRIKDDKRNSFNIELRLRAYLLGYKDGQNDKIYADKTWVTWQGRGNALRYLDYDELIEVFYKEWELVKEANLLLQGNDKPWKYNGGKPVRNTEHQQGILDSLRHTAEKENRERSINETL